MFARTWLIVPIAAAACGDQGDPRPSPLASSVAQAASSSRGSAAATVPAGWRREALTAYQLAASIAVPGDATLTGGREPERDADGLAITIPTVTITREAGAIRLSSDVAIGWVPTTLAAELADNARRATPFAVEGSKETPTGEWAVAYRLDAEDCQVHGGSPRAKVWCQAAEQKIRCAAISTVLQICSSIEPSGSPIEAGFDAAGAFPRVSDPQAAQAAVTVARAISRDDRDALLGMVAPTGMMLKGKKVSVKALRALLAGDTIQRAFEMRCKPLPGQRASQCAWTAEGDIANDQLAVLANDGDGLVPRFTLSKGAGGRWLLGSVDMADLGSP